MDNLTWAYCPYNRSHRLLALRLPQHLLNCEKLYPNIILKTCPFNATHRVQEGDYLIHISTCPDRRLVESAKYSKECAYGSTKFPVDTGTESEDGDWNGTASGGAFSTTSVSCFMSGEIDCGENESNVEDVAGFSELSQVTEKLETVKIGTGRGVWLRKMLTEYTMSLEKPGGLKGELPGKELMLSSNQTLSGEVTEQVIHEHGTLPGQFDDDDDGGDDENGAKFCKITKNTEKSGARKTETKIGCGRGAWLQTVLGKNPEVLKKPGGLAEYLHEENNADCDDYYY